MTIDYRGWGNSEGFVRLISPNDLGGGMEKDESRHKVDRERQGVGEAHAP